MRWLMASGACLLLLAMGLLLNVPTIWIHGVDHAPAPVSLVAELPTLPPLPPPEKPTVILPSATPCPACPPCATPTATPTPLATGEIIVITWEDASGCQTGYDGLTTPIVADVLLIYQGEAEWMQRTVSLLTRPTGVAVYPWAASGVYGVQVLKVYGGTDRLYLCDGYQSALVEVGGMTLIAIRFGRW